MNSNENMPVCLSPPSTAEAHNSGRPEPRLILELWRFQPTGLYPTSSNNSGSVRLAMMDIELPDSTGFEAVAGALAQSWFRNTTIIFFSSDPDDCRLAVAREYPGSLFVPKPFELRKLAGLIRKLFPSEPDCERKRRSIFIYE